MAVALTAKQEVFVNAYLTCWNAAEAARRAGYSVATARSQGQRLLTNVDVAATIKERLAALAMPAEEVIARLAEHARSDPSEFFTFGDDGKVEGLNLTKDAPWHLVKSITPTAAGTKLELHDAQAALVHIGKAQGVFKDDPLVNLNVTPEQLAEMSDDELDALYAKLNSLTRRR